MSEEVIGEVAEAIVGARCSPHRHPFEQGVGAAGAVKQIWQNRRKEGTPWKKKEAASHEPSLWTR